MNVTVFLESYNQHVTGSIKIEIETDIEIIISFNNINETVGKNYELSKSYTVEIPQVSVRQVHNKIHIFF